MRLSRDDLFLQVAELFAGQSTCLRGQVGAVIVKDRRIISTGYNGAPPGMPHCIDVGCEVQDLYERYFDSDMRPGFESADTGCQRAIHAEANALAYAARAGISTLDATMYCTYSPCVACARLCVSAGIARYVYRKRYRVQGGVDMLVAGRIEIHQIP